MAWTLCSSGAAKAKAGANANSTITANGSILSNWSDEAEGIINAESRYDWTSNYGDVNSGYQAALNHACAALIAMNIINYDMSGYSNLLEATTMLDVLFDQYNRSMRILSDEKIKEKMT